MDRRHSYAEVRIGFAAIVFSSYFDQHQGFNKCQVKNVL